MQNATPVRPSSAATAVYEGEYDARALHVGSMHSWAGAEFGDDDPGDAGGGNAFFFFFFFSFLKNGCFLPGFSRFYFRKLLGWMR
jgi:hypothetical protein